MHALLSACSRGLTGESKTAVRVSTFDLPQCLLSLSIFESSRLPACHELQPSMRGGKRTPHLELAAGASLCAAQAYLIFNI